MNIHPIVQFLKDVFVNSVFQCCAKFYSQAALYFTHDSVNLLFVHF